ncbi:hypothetical protein NDU88_004365 [Pleurodeles waltl]|uniref:Uncharacterized protein n=1 Tax=Pleurodeles waltl TaxID=8319 RepID=A0AAV7TSF4_PLEWA|nr:hypothetical protein NDU88_004365 [Pleurodeles waltl]
MGCVQAGATSKSLGRGRPNLLGRKEKRTSFEDARNKPHSAEGSEEASLKKLKTRGKTEETRQNGSEEWKDPDCIALPRFMSRLYPLEDIKEKLPEAVHVDSVVAILVGKGSSTDLMKYMEQLAEFLSYIAFDSVRASTFSCGASVMARRNLHLEGWNAKVAKRSMALCLPFTGYRLFGHELEEKLHQVFKEQKYSLSFQQPQKSRSSLVGPRPGTYKWVLDILDMGYRNEFLSCQAL